MSRRVQGRYVVSIYGGAIWSRRFTGHAPLPQVYTYGYKSELDLTWDDLLIGVL